MKKTIKLRDMTFEQFGDYAQRQCGQHCQNCPLNFVCNAYHSWTEHKKSFTNEFLDQTVEIEVPDLLTEEEKGILKTIISIMRVKVDCVVITHTIASHNFLELDCGKNTYEGICIKDGLFKGLEPIKKYTLEDLGLEDK